ncbi:EH domain-containing and endocytosis protein 1-like [Daphnia pulicaria]|uniref:EH domain-containing and endocytosis protein 1-like n=1 Tax=Daphnia pulicaria TaxID=35523 RepID=UPI001EEBF232|nr:EH domain-containing and endocytosis protein 1-like [Daphnia pulicaria]
MNKETATSEAAVNELADNETVMKKKLFLRDVLSIPSLYIGPTICFKKVKWVYEEDMGIIQREVIYTPGLWKIFDEILINAVKNKDCDPEMDTIKIDIDPIKKVIKFYYNGKGIPIIVHRKQREFNTELITVLTREALLQQAGLQKSHTELIKEKEKVDKKWKAAEEKLIEQRDDVNKLDQLKKDNATNLKLLDDSQNHVETLQQQLREAENYNANGNQTVKDLEEKIKILESDENTTAKDNEFQLKKTLDIKEKHISVVEANSLEANNTLESEKEQLENNLTAGRKHIETLSNQITALKREKELGKQLITQITQTKEKNHNNYVTATLQIKKYEEEIIDLKDDKEHLENRISNLEERNKDLKDREKAYHEAEDQYERNFQEIAEKTFETTKFIDELQSFTGRDSVDKSLFSII